MSLKDQLTTEMKEAMKAKDSLRLGTIRLIRTEIKNREIEARGEIDDAEVVRLLSTLVKQRKEAIQMYREGAREDLAVKETAELQVIQEFLPQPLSEQEILAIIDEAIAQTGAASMRDMGKVMKLASEKTVGRADGKHVSELVKARLSS